MNNYKNLKVWQKSMDLVEMIYNITKSFPREEIYGITSQIQRSAVSIPSNIAEGAGRNSEKQFCYFLSIANGSAYELNTQLLLAIRLGYTSKDQTKGILELLNEIEKMCFVLIKKLSKE